MTNNAVTGNKQVTCWLSCGRGQCWLRTSTMPTEYTITVGKYVAFIHAVHILWISEGFHAQRLSSSMFYRH